MVLVGALASTWTGIAVAGFQLVDLALAFAMGLVFLDALTAGRRLNVPGWIAIGTASVLTVASLHIFMPSSSGYLYTRFRLLSAESTALVDGSGGTLLVAARWCVALFALPLVVIYLSRLSEPGRFLNRLAMFWVIGAAASSAVGMLDWAGLTSIGAQLIGKQSFTGRQSGLASHANNLGFAAAVVVPFAVRLFQHHRGIAVASLILLAGGAFVTGSRGAQVGFIVAIVSSAAILRAGRAVVGWVLVVGLTTVILVSQLAPQLVGDLSSLWRFDGAGYSDQSDFGRSELAGQALMDFTTHPTLGVGMSIITHAHSVPLQILASGGIVLVAGMTVYWAGAISAGFRNRSIYDGMSLAGALSVILWLGQAVVQNQLVDRYLYVPVAIIAAISVLARDRAAAKAERS